MFLATILAIAGSAFVAIQASPSQPANTSSPFGGQDQSRQTAPAAGKTFVLRSPEVADGGTLPTEFTGDGASATLPLEWSGAPAGTASYAVVMHHIDPQGITKWYWILYNIPVDVKSLPKNVTGIGTLGNNSVNRRTVYAPPHSKGPGTKTYVYTVYALSGPPTLTVPPLEVNREVLLTAMKDLILDSAELRVTYTRFPEPDGQRDREGGPPSPPGTSGGGRESAMWIPMALGSITAGLLLFFVTGSAWNHRLRLPWVRRTALIVLIAGHFCVLMMYFEPAIGTPDASGYCVQTRLIATEGRTWFERESPLQYVNHHWLSPGGDRYFSQYPPGLSAISAIVFRIAGPTAALLVNPVLSSLTLLGLYLLCRAWMGAGWGLVAAIVMAVNPIANEHALSCDSHTAVAFLLVWGLYLLALWSRNHSVFLAFSAGAVLGIIPTIRYPEALFLLAAAFFVLLHFSKGRNPLKSLLAAAVGTLIPVSCLLVRNHFAFGSFWRTGYTLTNEQAAFAWEHLVRNAIPYAAGIMGEGTGLLAGIGLVTMMVLCVRRATRRDGLLLLALVIPVTVLYMAYALPMASIRFLIPTFSLYILAAVWGFKLLAGWRPRVAAALATTMIVATACWGLPRSVSNLGRLERDNGVLAAVTQIVTSHAAPGSVVIADPRIQQQLDYIGRWKLVDESLLTGEDPESGGPPRGGNRELRGGSQPRRDNAGGPRAVHERERQQILERYTDRQGPALAGRMIEDLDAWRGSGRVYWIGDLTLMRRLVPQSDQLQVLARTKVASLVRRPPPPPGPRPPRGSPSPPPRDQERREDAGKTRPDQRLNEHEIVIVEWTRSDASR